jgi:UDP-N-acetylmuramyl pentapeptide phosphotransferase/UDP-N-acetylglucosamine-1-phosphate transferase
VSLLAGPAVVVAGSVTAALGAPDKKLAAAALAVGLAAGGVGRYDDTCGAEEAAAKGFRGHLRAASAGRLSGGAVKVLGIGAVSVLAAGAVSRSPAQRLVAGGVIAGAANLVNLLDLRPGRALKAYTLAATPLLSGPYGGLLSGPVGAAVALLPDDLGERVMLGDAGANGLGALLGLRLAAGASPRGRIALLAGLAALTATSEVVSFSKVIAATPGLRELDALGRRPTQ